jgi:hypothetical protein
MINFFQNLALFCDKNATFSLNFSAKIFLKIITSVAGQTGLPRSELESSRKFYRLPQGCQMAHYQTKSPILGKLWRILQWKMLV